MAKEVSLSYRNENDRCYGATGMAIGLVVFDGEDYLNEVNLDDEAGDMMVMNEAFYFTGNPSLSAKAAWNRLLKNFNLMSVMMISNAMCRTMVMDSKPLSRDLRDFLHARVVEEGHESCQLEDDEIERLFEKDFNYLYKVFSHHGVMNVAHDFARTLSEHRSLSRQEVLEQLRALAML